MCVCVCGVAAGAGKLLAPLQTFKLKYAEARAKEHPELQQVYADKIAGLKAAGESGDRLLHGSVQLVGLDALRLIKCPLQLDMCPDVQVVDSIS